MFLTEGPWLHPSGALACTFRPRTGLSPSTHTASAQDLGTRPSPVPGQPRHGALRLYTAGTTLLTTLPRSRTARDTRGQNPPMASGARGSRARSSAPQAVRLHHQGSLRKVHLVESGPSRQSQMVRASEQSSRTMLRASLAPQQRHGPSAPLQRPPGLRRM
jgi:hypothetical protein